jgi:hypothetical protein
MLGWIILFALMSLGGAVMALAGDQVGASVKMGGLLFFVLFLLGLFTRFARGGAR